MPVERRMSEGGRWERRVFRWVSSSSVSGSLIAFVGVREGMVVEGWRRSDRVVQDLSAGGA